MPSGVYNDPNVRIRQNERMKTIVNIRWQKYRKAVANNSNTPTLKQKLFAKAYVKHRGNGAKAAMEAYDTNGKTAKGIAYQNINKPVVQKEIKGQLIEAGLGIEDLNQYSKQLISNNLQGKPSQAVAASMIQFAYKLHNVLPATKKMSMNLSIKDQVVSKDFDELRKLAEKQTEVMQALLQEIKG